MVVALHAGVADRRCWRGMIDRLDGAVTVVSYDRRGYGETPPATAPFSHLDDLRALLNELGEAPVWLLGNSMGGGLALDLSLEAPERVAGLLLLSPSISGVPERPLDQATQRLADLIDPAFEAGEYDEVNRLETWLWLDGPGQEEGRVKDPVRALAMEMNAMVLANEPQQQEFENAPETDAWARLSQIEIPVVVGAGTLDVPSIVTDAASLASTVAQGSFVALDGVAHLPSLEAPGVVAGLVRGTLEG